MATFSERKAHRTDHYRRFVHGWKQRPCTACAGSGYYDNGGSPPCGACDGTGKELFKPAAHQATKEAEMDEMSDPLGL